MYMYIMQHNTVRRSEQPLEQLGFWRIVLDEAQLVSATNSVAAQMAARLWRRHAWVVTGTPISGAASLSFTALSPPFHRCLSPRCCCSSLFLWTAGAAAELLGLLTFLAHPVTAALLSFHCPFALAFRSGLCRSPCFPCL